MIANSIFNNRVVSKQPLGLSTKRLYPFKISHRK